MKLAVCGKGGVGKTFIAGTLAQQFARQGHAVIAIDADSSPNLARTLGLSVNEASRILPVAENEDLIRLKTGTDYSGVFRLTFTVADIIADYAVKTPGGAGLLVMGTVKAMGSGCTCPAHSVIKALMRHLVVERDEIVILDMEAGIEHLGRGTAEHVDTLLVVTDANQKSRETAATIIRLARSSAIRDIRILGNRVASGRDKEILLSFAQENTVPLAAVISYDPVVADAGVTGEPVNQDNSRAVMELSILAGDLMNENRPIRQGD